MTPAPLHPPSPAPETNRSGTQFPAKPVSIEKLRLNDGTQTRAELSQDAVKDYAEKLAEKGASVFPPVVVFGDDENGFWLADGFHRIRAAQEIGWTEIMAEIRPGNRRDAFIYSLAANAAHGVQRTNADKRRSVEMALQEESLSDYSSRQIAELCGVGNQMVSILRKEREAQPATQLCESHNCSVPTKRKGRDGKRYSSTKSKRGKRTADQLLPAIANSPTTAIVQDDDLSQIANAPLRGICTDEEGNVANSVDNSNVQEDPKTPEASAVPTMSDFTMVQPSEVSPTHGPLATDNTWSDGLIALERVQDRLSVADKAHPSTHYNQEQLTVFKEYFLAIAGTINRVANKSLAGKAVCKLVAADVTIAVSKLVSSLPTMHD